MYAPGKNQIFKVVSRLDSVLKVRLKSSNDIDIAMNFRVRQV